MKILLVYELPPEESKTYLLNISEEEWNWIRLTHSHLINTTAFDEQSAQVKTACIRLEEWLREQQTPLDLSQGPVSLTGIDFFVQTGFVL